MILLCVGTADAVTLGNARVNSFLSQPLDVEIDIVGLAPEQNQDLRLRIANQTHFDRLGIAYENFLADLTFNVVRDGQRWLVRVRSDRPINEPFVDFPLQMTWPGGSLIKQYTLLLDPPARVRPARTARPRTPPTAAPSQATPASEPTSSPFTYGPVRPGETLWPIARRFKPSGVTTRQMAMALLRANPHAFIDGNVNRLRTGVILTIPSTAFVEELDPGTADAEFAAQNRRWQASVATSQRPVEAPPRAVAPAPAPAPAATVSPDEAADDVAEVATDEQGQLRIVTEKDKLDMASASEQDLKEQLLLTMEEIESNRITTGAIESRLARLEGELNRMQELVDLKDAQIVQLQSELSAREAAEAPSPAPADRQGPDARQAITESAIDAAGPTAATAPARAVTPLPSIDAPPLVAEQPQASAWYEQYLWVVWALLGLLGLTAITMMLRRPQAAAAEVPMADLPSARTAPTPVYPREPALTEEDFKQAKADLRDIAEEPAAEALSEAFPDALPEEELPELEMPKRGDKAGDIQDGITDSLLDEMLQEGKQPTDSPATPARAGDFTDEDIASWVAELGAEADRTEARSANDDQLETDEDIPSILTELDDQLTRSQPEETAPASGIKLEPLDGVSESDAFNMSLDLARAYLEIGDQEGARDMLKQALSGARDPEHRRQIEELLQQIG